MIRPHLLTYVTMLLVLCSCFSAQVFAHELQPSSLELRQLTSESYEVIWRAPIYYGKPHPARLQLPDHWQTLGTPTVKQLTDSALHRRMVTVPDGIIEGDVIRFVGLEATITDVFVRFVWLDGNETTAIARPSQPFVDIATQRSTWQVVGDYTMMGVDHILSGFDHLTFVLALLLIVSGTRRLIITITAFTLAHSITLAAATLGLMWIPGPPVEATIALSILFLASELMKVKRGEASMTADYPWLVAFVFGLLHGFGFAGALSDVGLPEQSILLALVFFNVGVELGQLLFVAAILVTGWMLHQLRHPQLLKYAETAAIYSIGGISSFWLIERISLF